MARLSVDSPHLYVCLAVFEGAVMLTGFSLILLAGFALAQATIVPTDTTPPTLLENHACPGMRYPTSVLKACSESKTTLSFYVEPDGTVKDVAVVESSGFKDADQTAATCTAMWKYKPAMRNGQPVEFPWHTVVVWKQVPGTCAAGTSSGR